MDTVECIVEPAKVGPVPGVTVTCRRCGFCRTITGTRANRVRAALAGLREGCPEGGANFYVGESGEHITGLPGSGRRRKPSRA